MIPPALRPAADRWNQTLRANVSTFPFQLKSKHCSRRQLIMSRPTSKMGDQFQQPSGSSMSSYTTKGQWPSATSIGGHRAVIFTCTASKRRGHHDIYNSACVCGAGRFDKTLTKRHTDPICFCTSRKRFVGPVLHAICYRPLEPMAPLTRNHYPWHLSEYNKPIL